jgi:hypothetical protein
MTGKADKNFVPSIANGDILPNLVSGATARGDFGFNVKYGASGQIDSHSDLMFSYNTGTKCNNPNQAQNCYTFELNATSIAWFTTQGTNNSTGIYQGTAQLNAGGVISQVTFRLTGVDGGRINATADTFQLSIFSTGSDPNSAAPIYKVNTTSVGKGSVKIQ